MNRLTVSAFVASIAVSSVAQADVVVYQFVLDGLQEVPSVATPGIGNANVVLNTLTGAVSITGSYEGLIGGINNAHLHGLAPVGVNAGVIFGLNFTPGTTSGIFTGNGILNPTQIQGMLDGLTYINIHSTFRPGGEIRGQVVPTPAGIALLGLGGLVAARRQRG